MRQGNSTNFLYTIRLFCQKKHKRFYGKLVKALEKNEISYRPFAQGQKTSGAGIILPIPNR